jgi:methylated-DNA-[protein]-cysteine S-methyltransferase
MKLLYTTTAIIGDQEYTFAATDYGLAYFDLVTNDEDIPKFFKGYQVITDSQKVASYVQPLKDYFAQTGTSFPFALDLIGTDFQKQVWQELLKVPYGVTTTYSALAENFGRPTAVRAVANAVGRNPLLIVVPCHRVLGKDGSLTGFRGGLPLKRRLLTIEGHAYF